jgi:sRNA-binding protein
MPAPSVAQPQAPPLPQPVPQQQAPAQESPPVSPVAAGAGPSKSQQEQQARRALLDVFRARWPQAFPRDFRQLTPWALGIHAELAAQLPAQPLVRIKAALGLFQRLSGAGYLLAVLRGGPRYALDGSPRGEVTPEEQALAKRDLAAFYAHRKAQRQRTPAVRAQPAPPEP